MYLESAAEGLQVCSSDEEPRGAGGNGTQVTPLRPWRNQLCLKVSDGTFWLPPASRRAGSLRLNPAWMHGASLGPEQLHRYLFLQELASVVFGFFSITWDIPKWHELTVWGFQLPFPFLWNTWKKLLSLLRDKELQWLQDWYWSYCQVLTSACLTLLAWVSAGCLWKCPSPVGKDKGSTVGCWLSNICHPNPMEILCALEEEVKASTASVFILTCLFVNAL